MRPLPSAGDGAAHAAANAAACGALVDSLLARAADRAIGSWGNLPGVIRDAVQQARERGRPKVDWKRTLRLFSAATGRTRLVTTSRRESTRYGRNTLPGRIDDPRAPDEGRLVPGIKIKRLHSLLVAIDTSGSIGPDQLAAFFNEIDGIWRAGTHVTVVACDAAVQESFPYRGVAPGQIGGGGGTAFEPVFL